MSEIKECPVCRNSNAHIKHWDIFNVFIKCDTCGHIGEIKASYELAVESWNRQSKVMEVEKK
jgi:hypothetical protein